MAQQLDERVTFRLRSDEAAALRRDAGGPSKVSAYLRGVLRGAGVIGSQQTAREEEEDGR